jgi:hypothetical protein
LSIGEWFSVARDNKGFACHAHHDMVSYEWHHIWPSCYHGPDTAANLVKICPSAHSDIHYLMERLLRGKPVSLIEYGLNVRKLAIKGYHQVIAYAEEMSR